MYEKFNQTTNARRSNKRWPTFEIISIDPSSCRLTPSTEKEKNIHPHPNARILLATLNFSHHISLLSPRNSNEATKKVTFPVRGKITVPAGKGKLLSIQIQSCPRLITPRSRWLAKGREGRIRIRWLQRCWQRDGRREPIY